jgi:hypothetical protein
LFSLWGPAIPAAFRSESVRFAGAAAAQGCYAQSMPEERPEASSKVNEYVAILKSKIPPLEHGALDSRVEQLLNDPSADTDDAILILRQEFDPDHKP